MEDKNSHYYSKFPDVDVKIYTISESLRRHLYIFKTITGVFSFNKIDLGTKVLIEHMHIPKEKSKLLDLGCGYGPIGMVLGYESPESTVYLIDLNKRAVWCAKENIKLNLPDQTKSVIALSGDLFEPFKNKDLKFDGIYMNPPIRQGRKIFLKILDDVQFYLEQNGSFQFVIRKKMGAPFILQYLKDNFPNKNVEILCKRSGYWVFKCFHLP